MAEPPQTQAPAPADFLARATEGMGSRFQSQASIDESNNRKEKQWQEAYARLGQEPPKVAEFAHDGLTLFERLEMNKRLNTEEWDDKMKLANQYRGINADEKRFLDERYAEKMAAQKLIDDEVNREMLAYRQAKNAGGLTDPESAPSTIPSTPSTSSPAPAVARKPLPTKAKKDVKSLLKGVVVKKKPKPTPDPAAAKSNGKIGPTAAEVTATKEVGAAGMTALGKRLVQEDEEPEGESDKRPRN